MAVACDPEDLVEQAVCLDCLSQAQLDAVEAYLLCLWAYYTE